jgi:tetratricopeptide (TPR) repeat protein
MGIDVPELAAAQDTEHHTPPSVATIRDMLAEARAKGEKRREALLLQSLGQHNMDMGRVPEAIDFFKQALVAFETVNDSDGMLASLDVLASLAAHAGNTQEALVFATRGVNFAGQINDKTRLGKLMLRLGDIRLTLGEVASAIDTYQKAVETLRSTEAWVSIGVAMTKLGRAQLQGQRPEDARQVLEPALAIFRKERRADHEARALGELGRAYTALQAWREAEEHHEQALMLAREQFDQVTEAEQYVALGYLHELLNDREGAILFYRRALHTAYQVEDVAMQVACAIQLGEFLVEDTRTLNQAVLLLREANEKRPSAQAERLLKRADQRLRRAASAGLNIPPAGTSNRAYAAEAYVA